MAPTSRRKPVPVHRESTKSSAGAAAYSAAVSVVASHDRAYSIPPAAAATTTSSLSKVTSVGSTDQMTRPPVHNHHRSRSWLTNWLKSGGSPTQQALCGDENAPPPVSALSSATRPTMTRSKSEVRGLKSLSMAFKRKSRRGSSSERAPRPQLTNVVPASPSTSTSAWTRTEPSWPTTRPSIPPPRPEPPTPTPDQDFASYRFPVSYAPHHSLPATALTSKRAPTPTSATSFTAPPPRPSIEHVRHASWDWDGGPGNISREAQRRSLEAALTSDRSRSTNNEPVDLGSIWDDLNTDADVSLGDISPSHTALVFPSTPLVIRNDSIAGEQVYLPTACDSDREVLISSTNGLTSHDTSFDTTSISVVSLSAFPSPPLPSGAIFDHYPHATNLVHKSSLAERRGRKQSVPALIIPMPGSSDLTDGPESDDSCYSTTSERIARGKAARDPASYFSPISPSSEEEESRFDTSTDSSPSILLSGLAISHLPSARATKTASFNLDRLRDVTPDTSDSLARCMPVQRDSFLNPFRTATSDTRRFASGSSTGEDDDHLRSEPPSTTFTATTTFSPLPWSDGESGRSFDTRPSSIDEEERSDCMPADSSFEPDWSLASASHVEADSSMEGDSLDRGKRWIEKEMRGVKMAWSASTPAECEKVEEEEDEGETKEDEEEDEEEAEDRTVKLAEAYSRKEVDRRKMESYDWGDAEHFLLPHTTSERSLDQNVVEWGVAL